MKCPSCGLEVKASKTLTCSCRYTFVINPKEYIFTDALLMSAVQSCFKE